MRRIIKSALLCLVSSLLILSCTSVEENDKVIDVSGFWDLTVFSADPNQSNYLIEVIVGGGSGEAQIQVYNNLGDDSGPSVVTADVPIALGSCGVNVVFSDSVGGPLNLHLGDRWNIKVIDGTIYSPESDPDNRSVAKIEEAGVYTCLKQVCDDGLYQTAVPLAYDVKVGSGLVEYEIPMLKVNQSDANLNGSVPEETVLSLWLVGHKEKQPVELCYRKRLNGGQGDNYFRVRLVDIHRYQLLDNNAGDNFNTPEQNVCVRFEPEGTEVRIDFIFGLANFNSIAWLDQIQERIKGATVFSYDFETGSLDNDLPAPQQRWQLREPAYRHGTAGISNIRPLHGNLSFRVVGGRSLPLTGSVLEQAQTDIASILGQVPGMNIKGVLFEIYENTRGEYFSSLSGALQETDGIIGTFTGEKDGCREQGQFIVGINQGKIYPVDRLWTMTLVGTAENCKGIRNFRETFTPFRPVQKAERFYSDANKPLLDRYLNPYQMNGRVIGTALYFVLDDYDDLDYRNALFAGLINTNPNPEDGDTNAPPEPNIAGTFNGWLGFKNDLKCQTSGTFQVFFPQPKSE